MYREERRICYTGTELIDALALYCKSNDRPFNFDQTARFTFTNLPCLKVRIANWNCSDGGLEFSEPEIVSALVILSKTLGIPLPKKATKTLEFIRDNIVLVMHLEHDA